LAGFWIGLECWLDLRNGIQETLQPIIACCRRAVQPGCGATGFRALVSYPTKIRATGSFGLNFRINKIIVKYIDYLYSISRGPATTGNPPAAIGGVP